jgi:hypothetical protein
MTDSIEEINSRLGLVTAPSSAKRMGFWKERRGSFRRQDHRRRMAAEVEATRGIMTQEQIDACMVYMGAAMKCAAYLGFASCRLCGEMLGTCDMLTPNKKWIFPEKWQHYILLHGVKPDAQFIRDAVSWAEGLKR